MSELMRLYNEFKDIEIVPQVAEQFQMVANRVFMIPWGYLNMS